MNHESYEKRLKALFALKKNAKTQSTINLCDQAINKTEASLHTLQRLTDCAEERRLYDKRVIDNRINQNKSELEKTQKMLEDCKIAIETKTDELSQTMAISKLRWIRLILNDNAYNLNTELYRINSYNSLKVPFALAEQLFDEIFYPDQKSFQYEAAVKTFRYTVSLIPIFGHLIEGIDVIYEIVMQREKTYIDFDNEHWYLEQYCSALEIWESIAQKTIKSISVCEEDSFYP